MSVPYFIGAIWQYFHPVAAAQWRARSFHQDPDSPARIALMRIVAVIIMILIVLVAIAYIVGLIN